jgi:hypothetical protein
MSSDSDSDSEIHEIHEILTKETFYNKYGYDLLLFTEELKKFNYFLDKMFYTELFDFISSTYFNQLIKTYNISLFSVEYHSEINDTLYVLNNFLKRRYKNLQISHNQWSYFCFIYTTQHNTTQFNLKTI